MTANKWPGRATRSARIGSLSGIVAGTGAGSLLVEASEAESSESCSTELIPGVWGVIGVMGVGGTMS